MTGRQPFTQWRALIAEQTRLGNPYVSFAPNCQDVLDMMDELERLRAREVAIDWNALKCRFGCSDAVAGIYHAPEGCWCFPDPVQALCRQHAIKGLQNNDMHTIVERPKDP